MPLAGALSIELASARELEAKGTEGPATETDLHTPAGRTLGRPAVVWSRASRDGKDRTLCTDRAPVHEGLGGMSKGPAGHPAFGSPGVRRLRPEKTNELKQKK